MKIVIWILQGLLATSFLLAGTMKMLTPYEELLANPDMVWAADFSAMQLKIVSGLEVLGAIGLIAPMFVPKMRFFMPLAAVGLSTQMLAAVVLHIGRDEPFIAPLILMILLALLAFLRRDLFFVKQV